MSGDAGASKPLDQECLATLQAMFRLQWWTRFVLGVSCCVLICIVVARFLESDHFKVQRINVNDDDAHVTAEPIRYALAASDLKGNFFTISLSKLRKLLEQVPWVSHAEVRRVWPDQLDVSLIEHRPIAIWSDGRVVSDQGVLVDVNADEIDGLVDFTGPTSRVNDMVQRYYHFRDILQSKGLTLSQLILSERGGWTLNIVDGPTIELGRDPVAASGKSLPTELLDGRLKLVLDGFDRMHLDIHDHSIARIDCRYVNGFALEVQKQVKPVTAKQS